MGLNLSKKPQHPGFVTPFFVIARELQCAPGALAGLVELAGEEVSLAQPGHRQRMASHDSFGGVRFDGRLQQGKGFLDAPSEGIGQAQARSSAREVKLNAPLSADGVCSFKGRDGPVEITLLEVHTADAQTRMHDTKGSSRRLGDPQRVLSSEGCLLEFPQLGQAPDQIPGKHSKGTKRGHTGRVALKGPDGLNQGVPSPTILASLIMGRPTSVRCCEAQIIIREGVGSSEGGLAQFNGAVRIAGQPEIVSQ